MSTHATITLINQNDEFETIWCECDGYPSHMAPILTQEYDTPKRVQELINLGHIDCLLEDIDLIEIIDDFKEKKFVNKKYSKTLSMLDYSHCYVFYDNQWYCDGALLGKGDSLDFDYLEER